MTRINLIPVEELSDQHLLAEYKELPRCIKQDINIKDSPTNYCLGKGHMKWARNHLTFLLERYKIICSEMVYRGFTVNYSYEDLRKYAYDNCSRCLFNGYIPTHSDIILSRNRIIEKLNMKPQWYRWTKRVKPI